MRVILGLCMAALLALISAPAQAQRSNLVRPCHVALEGEGWTEAEVWAWDQICVGNIANMQIFSGDNGPCNPKLISTEVVSKRKVSSRFLRLIAASARYTNALPRPRVGLTCARIDGIIDLEGMDIASELTLIENHFTSILQLANSRVERSIDLSMSTFDSEIVMDGARIKGEVSLYDVTALGMVNLADARIDGSVRVSGDFFGPFAAVRAHIGGFLSFYG